MSDEIRACEALSAQLEPDARSAMQRAALAFADEHYRALELDLRPHIPLDKGRENNPPDIGKPHKIEQVFEYLRKSVFNDGVNSTRGEMSYIPQGGLYTSALADYVTAVFNRRLSHQYLAPGAVALEHHMIRWTARLFGFPDSALGSMAPGGSVANLIAVTTARDAADVAPEDVRRSVVYMTSQVHSSMIKAVRIAGLSACVVRLIDVDACLRMDPARLRTQVEADVKQGLPLMVVASCGTTDAGAVDPMDAIADVCEEHKVWLHVDAAYGGFFILVDELRQTTMKGIDRADSITVDPHKSLFLTFGCSIVLIREGRWLRESFRVKSSYFAHDMSDDSWLEEGGEATNPYELSPELSRPMRALKMWMPLLLHGLEPFVACLREKVLLTRYFHGKVRKLGFAVGAAETDLTICIHRFVPRHGDANAYNELLLRAVRADGRVFVSSTVIDGVFWIRAAILCFRTHLETVDLYLTLLKNEVERRSVPG